MSNINCRLTAESPCREVGCEFCSQFGLPPAPDLPHMEFRSWLSGAEAARGWIRDGFWLRDPVVMERLGLSLGTLPGVPQPEGD